MKMKMCGLLFKNHKHPQDDGALKQDGALPSSGAVGLCRCHAAKLARSPPRAGRTRFLWLSGMHLPSPPVSAPPISSPVPEPTSPAGSSSSQGLRRGQLSR